MDRIDLGNVDFEAYTRRALALRQRTIDEYFDRAAAGLRAVLRRWLPAALSTSTPSRPCPSNH